MITKQLKENINNSFDRMLFLVKTTIGENTHPEFVDTDITENGLGNIVSVFYQISYSLDVPNPEIDQIIKSMRKLDDQHYELFKTFELNSNGNLIKAKHDTYDSGDWHGLVSFINYDINISRVNVIYDGEFIIFRDEI